MPPSIAPQHPVMTHEEAFRQSEGSVRLEGIDPTEYPEYLALKARILAGEIDSQQAIALLAAQYKSARTKAA
jgi:hypothetical protein